MTLEVRHELVGNHEGDATAAALEHVANDESGFRRTQAGFLGHLRSLADSDQAASRQCCKSAPADTLKLYR
jgi:hypothetical protein